MSRYTVEEFLRTIPPHAYYEITNHRYVKDETSYHEFDKDKDIIPYELQREHDITSGMSGANKVAFYWYITYPEQFSSVYVDGLYEALNCTDNTDMMDTLMNYGIIDPKCQTNLRVRNGYIVVIDEKQIANLARAVDSFCEEYLPEGAVPSHLIVNDNISNDVYLTLKDAISKTRKLRGVRVLNNYSLYKNVTEVKSKIETEKEKFRKFAGVTHFIDVTEDVKEIYKQYCSTANSYLYGSFKKAVEHVVNERDYLVNADPNRKVMIYSTVTNDPYIVLAVQLQFFYGISAILFDATRQFRPMISSLVYDSDYMQTGDRLSFLRNIPTFLAKETDFGMAIFIVYNTKLQCALSYVELDDDNNIISEVYSDNIDLTNKEFSVSNVTTLYPFDTINNIYDSDEALHRLLLKFYGLLEEENAGEEMLHPCNTFLLEKDGTRYLAKLESITDFLRNGLVRYLELNDYTAKDMKSTEEIYGWMPLEFYDDAEPYMELIYSEIVQILGKDIPITPYKVTESEDALFFRYLFLGSKMNMCAQDVPQELFVECMVNTPTLARARKNKIWKTIFNDNYKVMQQLTSFYCTNLINPGRSKILLDEVCLATKDLVRGGLYE